MAAFPIQQILMKLSNLIFNVGFAEWFKAILKPGIVHPILQPFLECSSRSHGVTTYSCNLRGGGSTPALPLSIYAAGGGDSDTASYVV